ncbi:MULTISPECIES: hypothetical protein [Agrobacterium]|uniref:Uncharacterized protein n=1 Tax=Agrobacterium tumefaciens TaxID=358 RepID=A0A4D7YM74_AGRTU|nr:hypothetical protein [Agrobacterium tumefaciens]QCL96747.1 hypothetical protein CFBP7129_21490 [Agrobacterium tumefaciens]
MSAPQPCRWPAFAPPLTMTPYLRLKADVFEIMVVSIMAKINTIDLSEDDGLANNFVNACQIS